MNRAYETVQHELGNSIAYSEVLLKALPSALRQMKQIEKDLRVVEYDYHRGDGVSEKEYKAILKRWEDFTNGFWKLQSTIYKLSQSVQDLNHSSYAVEGEIEKASPGRVARRFAMRPHQTFTRGRTRNDPAPPNDHLYWGGGDKTLKMVSQKEVEKPFFQTLVLWERAVMDPDDPDEMVQEFVVADLDGDVKKILKADRQHKAISEFKRMNRAL